MSIPNFENHLAIALKAAALSDQATVNARVGVGGWAFERASAFRAVRETDPLVAAHFPIAPAGGRALLDLNQGVFIHGLVGLGVWGGGFGFVCHRVHDGTVFLILFGGGGEGHLVHGSSMPQVEGIARIIFAFFSEKNT